MTSLPFLLAGVDADGCAREIGFSDKTRAVRTGIQSMLPDDSGPPWQSWEVWGNDPMTEEWRCLHSSE